MVENDYPSGTVLLADPHDEITEKIARDYISANGYSSESVKLVRDKINGQLRVVRR